MTKDMKELEKEMEKLILCKSFTEVKKKYSKEDMIELIKKYMKNEPLDYETEIETKLEECTDTCKSPFIGFN
jgi:hypothetical protein